MKIIVLCFMLLGMSLHANANVQDFVGRWKVTAPTGESLPACFGTELDITQATGEAPKAQVIWADAKAASSCAAFGLKAATPVPSYTVTGETGETALIKIASTGETGEADYTVSVDITLGKVANKGFPVTFAFGDKDNTKVTAQATLIPKPELLGTFTVTPDVNNPATCCLPPKMTFTEKAGTISVAYTLPTTGTGEACAPLKLTGENSAVPATAITYDYQSKWENTISGTAVSFTLKQTASGSLTGTQTVTGTAGSCPFNLAAVPIDYTNIYSVQAATGESSDPAKCCVPKTFSIASDANNYYASATFDSTSAACQTAGITAANQAAYVQTIVKTSAVTKMSLDFTKTLGIKVTTGEVSGETKPIVAFSAVVSQGVDANGNSVTSLTETLGTTNCAATLTAAIPAGNYDVQAPTTLPAKCCFPRYVNFIAPAAAPADQTKYTVEYAFPSNANCQAYGIGVTSGETTSAVKFATATATIGGPITVDFKDVTGKNPFTAKIAFQPTITTGETPQIKNSYSFIATEQVVGEQATTCTATIVPGQAPDYTKIVAFKAQPVAGPNPNVADCCYPRSINVAAATGEGNENKVTVTAAFDPTIQACAKIGVTASNANYKQTVPKGYSLSLDFAQSMSIKGKTLTGKLHDTAGNPSIYSLDVTLPGPGVCKATYTAPPIWPNHWSVKADQANAAGCCVPNHLKIVKTDTDTISVTPKFNPEDKGCKDLAIAKKLDPIPVSSVGPTTPSISFQTADKKMSFTLTSSGETSFVMESIIGEGAQALKCKATGDEEPVNWENAWGVNTIAPTGEAAAKCCMPSAISVSKTAAQGASEVEYSVQVKFPAAAAGNGCGALSTITSPLSALAPVASQFSVQDPKNLVQLTFSKNADGKTYNIAELITGETPVSCTGELIKGKATFEGAWTVTPAENSNKYCCFPMSNIEIDKSGDNIYIQGRWDNTDPCKTIHFANNLFNGQKKANDLETVALLGFSVQYDKLTITPKIEQAQDTKAVTFSYTYPPAAPTSETNPNGAPANMANVACSASLKKVDNAKAVIFKTVDWANTWTGDKLNPEFCLPAGPIVIGAVAASGEAPAAANTQVPPYSISSSGTFTGKCVFGEDPAKALDISQAKFAVTSDPGPGDLSTIWNLNVQLSPYKNNGADGTVPLPFVFFVSYQLSQIVVSWNFNPGNDATTNKFFWGVYKTNTYKNLYGFPGEPASKDAPAAGGSTPAGGNAGGKKKKDSGPGAWVYVVVILVVVVLAIGGYYLYNRHKAAKLNQSLQDEYQKTLLKA